MTVGERVEKAKELVERFVNHQSDDYPNSDENYHAKQCALICVEQVIASCFHPNLEYWQEVKQEINKL